MNKSRTFLSSVFFLVLVGNSPVSAQGILPPSASYSTESSASAPSAYALRISAGDLLDVSVFDTPDLSTKVRVDAHGVVTLPLGGDLSVSGMTAEQAGHAVEARLREADILRDPHVSITVLEYATQGVTVLGEVKDPGVYPLLGAHQLLDLISAAGGVTPNAGKAVTVTHRDDPSHPVIVQLQTKAGSTVAFNVEIRPGDTIMVSRSGIVYVLGDVGKPGGFLIENNDRLTVLQAIALAEGANRTASLNHAKLIREIDGTRREVPVPLKKILADKAPDETLADGDILFVPSSAAKTALRDVESSLPNTAAASIYRVP
jgi:polysaccharide biosynthesis/export protein